MSALPPKADVVQHDLVLTVERAFAPSWMDAAQAEADKDYCGRRTLQFR